MSTYVPAQEEDKHAYYIKTNCNYTSYNMQIIWLLGWIIN